MKNRMKWYRGQHVMFLDDRSRPSDRLLARIPCRGDICTVRRVLNSTSQDTGERCTGLHLEGYRNPVGDVNLEYCYEAERFLPLKLIEVLLAKETSWTANVPHYPYSRHVIYNKRMIQLHEHLIKFFDKNHNLYSVLPAEAGVDAVIFAPLGNVAINIRYMDDDKVGARCFSPVRIQLEHESMINSLVHQLNDRMAIPRYGVDHRTNLAYCSMVMDIEEWSSGADQVESLLELYLVMVDRLFSAMTKVMYGHHTPGKAILLLDKENDEKNSPGETAAIDPAKRIKGLTGGNPALN